MTLVRIKIAHEFAFGYYQIMIYSKLNDFFFQIDDYDAVGPFKSEIETWHGLAEYYFKKNEALHKAINDFEKTYNSI